MRKILSEKMVGFQWRCFLTAAGRMIKMELPACALFLEKI